MTAKQPLKKIKAKILCVRKRRRRSRRSELSRDRMMCLIIKQLTKAWKFTVVLPPSTSTSEPNSLTHTLPQTLKSQYSHFIRILKKHSMYTTTKLPREPLKINKTPSLNASNRTLSLKFQVLKKVKDTKHLTTFSRLRFKNNQG